MTWAGRKVLETVGSQLQIVAVAIVIMKLCVIVSGTESPIVVVLSESMEPGMYRGDLLFLVGVKPQDIVLGDIVVFNVGKPSDIPIVHRVLEEHVKTLKAEPFLLTKGDNNRGHDRPIYDEKKEGLNWVNGEHVLGKVVGRVPLIGYPSILMNETPYVKFLALGALGLVSLFM